MNSFSHVTEERTVIETHLYSLQEIFLSSLPRREKYLKNDNDQNLRFFFAEVAIKKSEWIFLLSMEKSKITKPTRSDRQCRLSILSTFLRFFFFCEYIANFSCSLSSKNYLRHMNSSTFFFRSTHASNEWERWWKIEFFHAYLCGSFVSIIVYQHSTGVGNSRGIRKTEMDSLQMGDFWVIKLRNSGYSMNSLGWGLISITIGRGRGVLRGWKMPNDGWYGCKRKPINWFLSLIGNKIPV